VVVQDERRVKHVDVLGGLRRILRYVLLKTITTKSRILFLRKKAEKGTDGVIVFLVQPVYELQFLTFYFFPVKYPRMRLR